MANPEVGGFATMTLQAAINKFTELNFGQGSDLGSFQAAVLEYHQGGDAADIEFCRGFLVGIHIHLADFDAPFKLLGELIQNRGDHLARAAPGCPEIHQYWFVRFEYVSVKTRIAYM